MSVHTWIRNVSLCFSAGCIAGLIFGVLLAGSNLIGLSDYWQIGMKPPFKPEWLFINVVYGGIWGLLFLIPWCMYWPLLRGFIFSLIPTILIFFLFMPLLRGFFNAHFSAYTYWFVFVVNAIAGLGAGVWLKLGKQNTL